MTAYYNEFKPEAAAMLRQLISDGLIAPGEVDERSITEVRAEDVKGFIQCHWFAGIGGWSVALRQAGWPDTRPVWTGSCPCQPFSLAGKQKGGADERHLWPVWSKLIGECHPPIIFGEQVASAISHGWLDEVADDLEREGYATGAAVLPACSVGAPHKRDRLWFVAQSRHGTRRNLGLGEEGHHTSGERSAGSVPALRSGSDVANSSGRRRGGKSQGEVEQPGGAEAVRSGGVMGDPKHDGRDGRQITGGDEKTVQHRKAGQDGSSESSGAGTSGVIPGGAVVNADLPRSQGRHLHTECSGERTPWSSGVEWLACGGGKQRLVKSGVCLLAHGLQHRAPLLHAYGNAIVPQVAAKFIQASVTRF